MRAVKLFWRLTAYYTLILIFCFAWEALPLLQPYSPFGGAEGLLSGISDDPFESIEIGADAIDGPLKSAIYLFISVLGAIMLITPVTWVYMAIRKRDEYDQSLVETMMVLPLAVTIIVVIVHNSLALAFSLAGIVGGVRFRNTLKSSGDALFILLAIAIGLSAGIAAMEIAVVASMTFSFCFLILWSINYGARKGTHRYMRSASSQHGDKHHKESAEDCDENPKPASQTPASQP